MQFDFASGCGAGNEAVNLLTPLLPCTKNANEHSVLSATAPLTLYSHFYGQVGLDFWKTDEICRRGGGGGWMGEFLRGMIQTLYEMMESLFSLRAEWLIGAIGHESSDFNWAVPGGLSI